MENTINHKNTVKLENLVVGYRSVHNRNIGIFGPVSTEIKEAEMIGVIGRNGIGKSTLLRTIATLQPPVSGKVLLQGVPASSIGRGEMAKIIGFVSTEIIHSFEIKVEELIAMGRYPYTGWLGKLNSTDKHAIEAAIEQTGTKDLLRKSIHQLSDGERQKVMIARALAQDTPVIILDEPTAFLDLPARYDILRLLNNLSLKNNKTVIFSTHDLAIAIDVADKLWLLADNEIIEGAPEDLLIRRVFRKLFLNSPAEFDPRTSAFKFKRHLSRNIAVRGVKKYRLLTKKALERIGFQTVDEETEWIVEIEESAHTPVWTIMRDGKKQSFGSIYELITYLRISVEN
jgi:iron complex transport system ATP-binding protein